MLHDKNFQRHVPIFSLTIKQSVGKIVWWVTWHNIVTNNLSTQPEHFISILLITQKGIYFSGYIIWTQFVLINGSRFLFKDWAHSSLNWLTTLSYWSIKWSLRQNIIVKRSTDLGLKRLALAHIIHETMRTERVSQSREWW